MHRQTQINISKLWTGGLSEAGMILWRGFSDKNVDSIKLSNEHYPQQDKSFSIKIFRTYLFG